MDLFLRNKQLFTSQDVNWWTGVMWIIVVFLSFWRHPFTAEDPFMNMWLNATFLQICSSEETNSSTPWMAEGEYIFSKCLFLGELFLYHIS